MKPGEFHDQLDDAQIVQAIVAAEQRTSGEIRVFVSRHPCADPMAASKREFSRLGMARTPQRNGVLLYFAPRSRVFAVIGDEGIHLQCGDGFWQAVSEEMSGLLKAGRFTEAVLAGVARAGAELAKHFPRHSNDRDDLPNSVVRD